jgi:hypothetical protein
MAESLHWKTRAYLIRFTMQQFNESTPIENVTCDECGNFGALEIGERKLCADCVTLAGSGCAGSPAEE